MDFVLPTAPDAHGIAVLLLIVGALFLFTRESIPLETSSLVVLVLLAVLLIMVRSLRLLRLMREL